MRVRFEKVKLTLTMRSILISTETIEPRSKQRQILQDFKWLNKFFLSIPRP